MSAQATKKEPPLIVVERLVYEVEGRRVLDEVSFEVFRREIFGVMGLSGAGKTTLLYNLMGLVKPKAGRILIEGVDITRLREKELNEVRLRMGMAFQYSALFDSLNVFENVAFGLRRRGLPEEEIRRRVAHYLEIVEMSGTEEMRPAELSGGMRKRVSIARALATEPEVMLFDEPTSGLDPILASAIDQLIMRLRNELGVSVIVVTHDVPHLFRYADRALLLYEGRVVACGTPAELRQSDNPLVQQFITGSVEGPIKVL